MKSSTNIILDRSGESSKFTLARCPIKVKSVDDLKKYGQLYYLNDFAYYIDYSLTATFITNERDSRLAKLIDTRVLYHRVLSMREDINK